MKSPTLPKTSSIQVNTPSHSKPVFLRFKYIGLTAAILLLISVCQSAFSQSNAISVNPSEITIVRDHWGVPHIYAPTDAGTAYGLGWATSEDDFKSIQQNLLGVRGRLGEVMGKEGAIMDIAAFLVDVDGLVEAQYDTSYSPAFYGMLDAYAQALNDYAKMHPEEILLDDVFPVDGRDLTKGYTLALCLMTGVARAFELVLEDNISKMEPQAGGSNAMAFSKKKMSDGNTHLVLNSHQPLAGPLAWYEAHLVSEQGLNILGANFPGGVSMFTGTTPNLGWAHTLNYPDLVDVYKLQMEGGKSLRYRYDGQWLELQKRVIRIKVKVGFLKLPVKRTFYQSVYGVTLRNKSGYYSLRFPAALKLGAAEQWYHMNKAQNFEEFREVLSENRLPGMNLVYADRDDNIFYISNGWFPERNPQWDWKKVLPGDTSATLWPVHFDPIDSVVQVLNPDCGYLFNTNNTPFHCTCAAENPDARSFDKTKGYQTDDNNRALRFAELVAAYDQLSYDDLKTIKYDRSWSPQLYSSTITNFCELFDWDPTAYKPISESLQLIQQWNRQTDPDNSDAAVFVLTIYYALEGLREEGRVFGPSVLSEDELEAYVLKAQKHLKRHFGRLDVPLGEVQRHVRGEFDWPIGGSPDVLAATYVKPWKKGRFSSRVGDSYILFVRYTADGPLLESVNAYGTSTHETSAHYADQVPLYLNQKLKKMSMDREEIFRDAERIYHPGQ